MAQYSTRRFHSHSTHHGVSQQLTGVSQGLTWVSQWLTWVFQQLTWVTQELTRLSQHFMMHMQKGKKKRLLA